MIDRAGDGDGDAISPARKRPADAPPADAPITDDVAADGVLSNTAQLEAAHVEYRDAVDNAYGRSPDPWAAALPQLRAAWEQHEEKYPERSRLTPRCQPDGSWKADGNRSLNPDQNAEATKICADIRRQGTEVVLPAMQRVEAADPTRGLAGLPHMLKGEDRLKGKDCRRTTQAWRDGHGGDMYGAGCCAIYVHVQSTALR